MFGHFCYSFGGAGECTREGVFHASVDHALGGEGLLAAERFGFKQGDTEPGTLGAICQPKSGHAAADNRQI